MSRHGDTASAAQARDSKNRNLAACDTTDTRSPTGSARLDWSLVIELSVSRVFDSHGLGGPLEYASSAEAFQWQYIPPKGMGYRDVGTCVRAGEQEWARSIFSSVLRVMLD